MSARAEIERHELTTAPLARSAWQTRRRELFRRSFAIPPKMHLDEWADRYRYLSRENSAEPGRWNTDRTPYLREIMRAISDPSIEEIVVMKAARIGYTEGVIGNAIGYYIDQDPSPILVVQPTVEDAEGWSKDSLTPLIEATPRLRGKVKDQGSRTAGNTILLKRYPGGSIRVVGANSPRGFRRVTARFVPFDEVDGYPMGGAGTEGDQIALGRKRAQTYDNRKIIMGSTPTIKGSSRIELAFDGSTKHRCFVPCPHCGYFQVLAWSRIEWDKVTLPNGELRHLPETAHYVCELCSSVIEEKHKRSMVLQCEWRPEHPERRVRGFHISSLYSLFFGARWSVLVHEFLEATGRPELLQVWTNTVLGETWEIRGDQADPATLLSQCEAYPTSDDGETTLVPRGVGLLTMAVDVQDDRLEVKVKGWGASRESWLVLYETLWGDPSQADVWEQCEAIRLQRFVSELGPILRVSATVVDTGGHYTDEAYRYVRPRQTQNVFAIKGSSEPSRPIWPLKPSKTNKHGVKLFTVGTDTAKDVIFGWMRRTTAGPGRLHFPIGTQEAYFEGLTAEKKIPKVLKTGQRLYVYVKIRERNEPLDLEVYNLMALYSLGRSVYERLDVYVERVKRAAVKRESAAASTNEVPSTEDIGAPEAPSEPPPPPSAPAKRAPRSSSWVNRWRNG